MKLYRAVSLILVLLFAVTGMLFLFIPDRVLMLFNDFSSYFGLPQSPADGSSFYLILAVGYMYLVTVLAFCMFSHPEDRRIPLLLTHAKLASSVLSLAFFLLQYHYLVYLVNFFVDGAIGVLVLTMNSRVRRTSWASS
jgi:hypothetical protein